MMNTFRRAIIVLTLLVLGGGYAACACATVAHTATGADLAVAASASQDVYPVSHHTSDAGHCDEGSGDTGHDCAGCEAVALPTDISTKAVSAFPSDKAVPPPKLVSKSIGVFNNATLRIVPIRSPPWPSPSLVDLKIRLQN